MSKASATIIAFIVAIVAAVFAFRSCGHPPAPIISAPTAALRDSLAAARRADSATIARLTGEKESYRRDAEALKATADRSRASATSEHRLAMTWADSARSSHTLADSARYFERAYTGEVKRGDSLDVALDEMTRANAKLARALASSDSATIASETRRAALERLNGDLQRDITKARRGDCYLVGPIPCPNRRTAFVAGAIVGGGIAYIGMSQKSKTVILFPKQ